MCKLCMRILFLCFLILFINQSVLFAAEDEGYFLNLKQKGQLISLGLIQDNEGVWYNIWICPGYVPPYKYAKKYFFKTGSDFGEYFHAEKYHDLARHSKNSYRWAYDDCIDNFIIEGVPKAWEGYFQAASNRTEKRVFGWWFAYPWAFMESTVESIVRIPIGLTGSVLGTAWATVVVPAYYMTNSTIKGVWHLSLDTITIPVISGTWNTIISPPLALIGQKPSLDRVDGFWVKALTNEQVLNLEYTGSPISQDDIVLLEQWGMILDTELKPYENEYAQVKDEAATAVKKIRDEAAPAIKKIKDEQAEKEKEIRDEQAEKELKIYEKESQHMENLRTDSDKQQMLTSLSERGFTVDRLKSLRSYLRKALQENGYVDEKKVDHLIDLLIKYPPYPPSVATDKSFQKKKKNPLSHKTDPVRRSVDIMKDVELPHH